MALDTSSHTDPKSRLEEQAHARGRITVDWAAGRSCAPCQFCGEHDLRYFDETSRHLAQGLLTGKVQGVCEDCARGRGIEDLTGANEQPWRSLITRRGITRLYTDSPRERERDQWIETRRKR